VDRDAFGVGRAQALYRFTVGLDVLKERGEEPPEESAVVLFGQTESRARPWDERE
jgi:hypothetical protein